MKTIHDNVLQEPSEIFYHASEKELLLPRTMKIWVEEIDDYGDTICVARVVHDGDFVPESFDSDYEIYAIYESSRTFTSKLDAFDWWLDFLLDRYIDIEQAIDTTRLEIQKLREGE